MGAGASASNSFRGDEDEDEGEEDMIVGDTIVVLQAPWEQRGARKQ